MRQSAQFCRLNGPSSTVLFNIFLLFLCGNFLCLLGTMSVLTSPTHVPCPSPNYWEKNVFKYLLWIVDVAKM